MIRKDGVGSGAKTGIWITRGIKKQVRMKSKGQQRGGADSDQMGGRPGGAGGAQFNLGLWNCCT